MIFTDIHYSVFLLVVLTATLTAQQLNSTNLRNALLLIASYIFYGWWDPRFLLLLALSSGVDFVVALVMDGRVKSCPEWLTRKRALIASICVNLLVLGAFKYLNFFVDSAEALLASMNIQVDRLYLSIVLPVGISFYTFQSMSYSIDVYHRRQRAERNPIDFFLFVSFFPQLVAGPIERAGNLLAQIKKTRPINRYEIRAGLELIAFGLVKKLLIADNLARIVDEIFTADGVGALTLLFGVYAFAFQIYCDFSGYTDIARGSARLLGFRLRLNFHMPYFAASPRDFWRRWHISLSEWFRDYVYIPLGGRADGYARTAFNVLLTMALCGLWHGAAWTFILWGIYHGALLAFSPRPAGLRKPHGRRLREFRINWTRQRILMVIFTFHLVCFGWLIFRAENVGHLLTLLNNAWTLPTDLGLDFTDVRLFLILISPLVAVELFSSITAQRDMRQLKSHVRWGLVIIMFYVSLMGQPSGLAPFIYFQF